MQGKAGSLGLQGNQVSGEGRSAHQVIHAPLGYIDVSPFAVELHVGSGAFLGQWIAILEEIDADLLGAIKNKKAKYGPGVVAHFRGCSVTLRSHAVLLDPPTAG